MIAVGIDPGALRCGFSVIEAEGDDYRLIESGIVGLDRPPGEPFAVYRRRLLAYWCSAFPAMMETYQPEAMFSELVPAVGGGNFIAATQSELVKVVVTTCQVISHFNKLEWSELAGATVKKKMTGNGRATKVKVRDAVIECFPELLPRKKDLTKHADEADAIAVGLVGLGYAKSTPSRSARSHT